MSGIVGIYRLDGGPVDPADLGRMVETIAHRGPDNEGTHTDGSLALGHRMLWSTPESLGEKLPREDSTGDLVITADARVDNREDLFSRLGLSGHQSRRISDSELILAAYRAWGERCVDRLLGDFAFAIWDKRRRSLFCARDHFGVRPFYYYLSNGLFAFASEIKGLLCLPSVPRRLNELKVAWHLASIYEDVTSTFYTDILRLPPSHSITVDGNGARLSSYWSLDPSREVRLSSDGEYAESFREIFTEAVRCRLRSAYPVGSMLSGGLDSTSITCVARELLAHSGGGRLATFSAVFDTVARSDERGFIEAALAQNGVRPYYLHADKVSPLTDIDQVLWHQDEPVFAGNLYLIWCLYRAARDQGVRVVLDGFDGDTTVSHGTGYFIELARAGRWISLAQEVRAYTRHFDGAPWPRVLAAWVWRYGISPKTSKSRALMSLRKVLRTLLGRHTARVGSIRSAGLSPSFVQRIGLAERRQALRKASPRTEREKHYQRLTGPVMPQALETLNKAAGAFSIEPRFPFWDRRLAEFCLALPPEQKLHRGWNRIVMRRAMDGIVPDAIRWRGGKADLGPAFDHGLLTFERERLSELVEKDPGVIEEYVDMSALRGSHQRFVSGRGNEVDMLAVWKAVSLAEWLRRVSFDPGE